MSEIPHNVQTAIEAKGLGDLMGINDATKVPFLRSADYYCEEGIVGIRGLRGRVAVAHRWSEVTDVSCNRLLEVIYDEELGAVETQGHTTYQAVFNDRKKHTFEVGEEVERTLARDFFEGGLHGVVRPSIFQANRVNQHIQRKIAAGQIDRIRAQLREDRIVDFGALALSWEHIAVGDDQFPTLGTTVRKVGIHYPQYESLCRDPDQRLREKVVVAGTTTERQKKQLELPAQDVHNLHALTEILRM